MTEYVETRRFHVHGVSCEFELDLRTTDKTHVDIRQRNLQRMGYDARILAKEEEVEHLTSKIPIIVYSLYKHLKSAGRKYYPLTAGRLSS